MSNVINEQDLNLLLEALDAWVVIEQKDTTLVTALGIMLSGSKENADKFLEEMKPDRERDLQNRKYRSERAILLKAKLIQIRDRLEAKSFEDEVLGK